MGLSDSRILSTVHDELIVWGPEADAESVRELVAATRMHYTLRRTDARAGTVHVHFPRIGYVLRAAEPA